MFIFKVWLTHACTMYKTIGRPAYTVLFRIHFLFSWCTQFLDILYSSINIADSECIGLQIVHFLNMYTFVSNFDENCFVLNATSRPISYTNFWIENNVKRNYFPQIVIMFSFDTGVHKPCHS